MRRKERIHSSRIECFGQVKVLKKDFVNSVSEKLSLPPESLSAVPLIQLHGKRNLSIENHGGILEYSDTLVKAAVKDGAVTVRGYELSICRMTRRCLVIRGRIVGLELE